MQSAQGLHSFSAYRRIGIGKRAPHDPEAAPVRGATSSGRGCRPNQGCGMDGKPFARLKNLVDHDLAEVVHHNQRQLQAESCQPVPPENGLHFGACFCWPHTGP
jgi:hypothetical protein